MPIFRIKSVKIYPGQKKITWTCPWRPWKISGMSVDYNDPKECNDPQVLDDPNWISIGSIDFDNLKVYGDTSIFDGIVGGNLYVREIQILFN